ncbi:tRNA epoxyqueuosine(34) reductase QueG [Aestuariispira insulae]|uniref:Epoxyqueuosine reductase n=1 Tax=Aestuariispira insulae TaxID=1461337 RepID=A0A3D9HXU3_9PROT|nr:tRNA epoxyqueuosine(34) reductase QueG [Aestuariispira insulae]RED54240.1 epoxyqueuosine reductase [Aestuariispira insulae]
MTDLKAAIIEKAKEAGFDSVSFAPVTIPQRNLDRYQEFLEAGQYGDMDWMQEKNDWRRGPNSLWEECRTVIVLGMNYGPNQDPMLKLQFQERANISVYAQNKDYHDLVKKKLKQVARWLVETHSGQVKVFVDTAPVMEKAVAAQSGLGWQGKHTNLVSRDFGSWLFLGEIFTTLEIAPDKAVKDSCGNCQACLDICPTQAMPGPYKLDASRCISYLTIEHKSHIPVEFRNPMGNRIYGCDDCLAVCPWNKFAQMSDKMDFWPRAELSAPRLVDFLDLDDAGFRKFFSSSPIKRIGRNKFLRNVLIALGNARNPDLAEKIIPSLRDESPLVRAMAVWALGQLLDSSTFQALRQQYLPHEADTDVAREWG